MTSKKAPPNFYLKNPENLIFQGGGPKATAYVGALEVLEIRNILVNVKRVGGTSAGATIAALVAVGYTSSKICEFLSDNLLDSFRDFPSNGSLYKGNKFLDWIEKRIEAMTHINLCTFGDLRKAIKEGRTFEDGITLKHLHVFASKLSNKEIISFNSEDPKYDDVIISEAVRCSIGIPLLFKTHTPKSIDPKDPKKETTYEKEEYYSLVDGGMIYNFAINAFDKKFFAKSCASKFEEDCPITNKRTLAFTT